MNLGGKDLEEWFLNYKKHRFPKGNVNNYVDRYNVIKAIAKKAQNSIHQGNVEVENQKESGARTLTGHGPQHFEKVIKNASDLIKMGSVDLSSYEVFHLLCAIQIHDIGNIIGRENHNLNAIEVFTEFMPSNEFLDSIENSIFHTIAEVHTTEEGGDKDTITKLTQEEVNHNDVKIRQQLLAAILKLADELADDPERAFMYGVNNGLVKKGSHLHHVYCNSLTSTIIENKQVTVSYKFEIDIANQEFEYGKTKIHLLDYIFERGIKMHLERYYCQRFMRPHIHVDHIDTEIAIYSKSYKKKFLEIRYRLLDKGYPEFDTRQLSIKDICEDPDRQLKNENGEWWSGDILKSQLVEYAGK
jgi:hypothetical protein